MNMFLHHTTPGCHMAEKLFLQAPSGSGVNKHLPLRRNHKCVGAEFSHSTLPVVRRERLAVFSCLANESARGVSPPATSDSRSGPAPATLEQILSSPLSIPLAANRDAACHG